MNRKERKKKQESAAVHSPLTSFLKIRLFKAMESEHRGHRERRPHTLHLTPGLLQLIPFTCWVEQALDRNCRRSGLFHLTIRSTSGFMERAPEASKVNDLPKVRGKARGENGNRTVCPDLAWSSLLLCSFL